MIPRNNTNTTIHTATIVSTPNEFHVSADAQSSLIVLYPTQATIKPAIPIIPNKREKINPARVIHF